MVLANLTYKFQGLVTCHDPYICTSIFQQRYCLVRCLQTCLDWPKHVLTGPNMS